VSYKQSLSERSAHYKHKNQKGFGALEVIIAIFIIVVGLLALFGMSSRYLKTANYLKMKLTASFLAQEGVEAVRYIREINSEWGEWVWYDPSQRSVGSPPQNYIVQYNDSSFMPYLDNTPLRLDNGLYQYSTGANSSFYRTITLSKPNDDNEVKVEVEVKWQDSTGWQYVKAEDRLWNWR